MSRSGQRTASVIVPSLLRLTLKHRKTVFQHARCRRNDVQIIYYPFFEPKLYFREYGTLAGSTERLVNLG